MYVVMDIEWIDEGPEQKYLTQIAAIRVNENWETQDSFTRLVSPPLLDNVDWRHVAFNGYEPEEFYRADTEDNVLSVFAEWLQDGDTLCVWHHEAKKLLQRRWREQMGVDFGHEIKVAQKRVCDRLLPPGGDILGLYSLAPRKGIEMPAQRHCAKSDAVILRELLCLTFANWEDFRKKVPKPKSPIPPPHPKIPKKIRAERNTRIMETDGNNFYFTNDSDVYHKRGCPRILQAKSLRGAIYFEKASEDRRPCKICNPQPWDGLRDGDTLRYVTLFDGTAAWMKNRNIVGNCHYQGHPGIISRSLLEKHQCVEKQCRHLQKYPECVYWKSREEQEKAAQKEKEKKKASIAKAREEEQFLLNLRDEFQSYMEYTEEYMEIIRVEKVKSHVYKIYYVSDNRFADGLLFPDLVGCIQSMYPGWRVLMRHIKDMDGRFVTIDEFHARRRA